MEFALVAPVFILLLIAIVAEGLAGFYQLNLDEAVRNAARQMQIAGPASGSGPAFAAAVCAKFGRVTPDCTSNLTYDVQSNTPPANFAALTPVAMPPSGLLANVFAVPDPNSNVVVQAAYPLPLAVPFIGTTMTLTGTNSILSTTTIRMEPYS